jgi:hypothetical protein
MFILLISIFQIFRTACSYSLSILVSLTLGSEITDLCSFNVLCSTNLSLTIYLNRHDYSSDQAWSNLFDNMIIRVANHGHSTLLVRVLFIHRQYWRMQLRSTGHRLICFMGTERRCLTRPGFRSCRQRAGTVPISSARAPAAAASTSSGSVIWSSPICMYVQCCGSHRSTGTRPSHRLRYPLFVSYGRELPQAEWIYIHGLY